MTGVWDQRADLGSRFITGPVLVIAGVAIYGGLFLLRLMPYRNAWDAVGVALGAEAYGTVAGLFVLLGLRYIFGPKSWFEARIASSLRSLLITAALMGAVIVGAVLLILW